MQKWLGSSSQNITGQRLKLSSANPSYPHHLFWRISQCLWIKIGQCLCLFSLFWYYVSSLGIIHGNGHIPMHKWCSHWNIHLAREFSIAIFGERKMIGSVPRDIAVRQLLFVDILHLCEGRPRVTSVSAKRPIHLPMRRTSFGSQLCWI